MASPIEIAQRQAGELLTMRLLLGALIQQVPDINKLQADFAELSEDSTVRTMYATMPEPFFQGVLEQRRQLADLIAQIAAAR
jgi:hypothetical protein